MNRQSKGNVKNLHSTSALTPVLVCQQMYLYGNFCLLTNIRGMAAIKISFARARSSDINLLLIFRVSLVMLDLLVREAKEDEWFVHIL